MIVKLGPFTANDVNLHGNDYAAGLPSPSAALGFVGALARRCGVETWGHGVLPVIHELHASPGRIKSAPNRDMTPTEIPETLTGRIRFTLIADIPDPVRVNDLKRHVTGMRFAGGPTFPDTTWAGSVSVLRGATLADATSGSGVQAVGLDRGWAMIPPFDRDQTPISFGETDSLEDVAETVFPAARGPGSGWLVAVPSGYRLLESRPTQRRAVRDNSIGHSYAEPGVGVAELISVRNSRLTGAKLDDLGAVMWRWSCDTTHRHLMFSRHHLAGAIGPREPRDSRAGGATDT